MNTLYLDIETSPNVADVWGLWQQNVALSQLRESTRMICFGAAVNNAPVKFWSEFHHGPEKMIEAAWRLLDEADVVVHWNGKSFDIPHLRREFLEAGMPPPSPFKQLDLCAVAKRQFRFPSNKLDYVSRRLLGEQKVKHEGHTLWVKCMAGDAKAWAAMRKYCKQDVALLPRLHEKLLPWIPNPPSVLLHSDQVEGCPRCGSESFQRRGLAATETRVYQQYRCNDCTGWFRAVRSDGGTSVRSTA